jgi:Zn-dependent protease with chaperone function
VSFQADYFDGLRAACKPISVRVSGHAKNITFEENGENLIFNFADLEVQAKLGTAKRIIDLPNGGRLEATDISELEAAMPSKTSAFWTALHYLENHLGWVFVALLATVFAGWLFLQFGVPKLAEYVAKATPPAMERKLGEQALEGLDSKFGYFSPSKTAQKRKANIGTTLKTFCAATKNCPNYRLEFRAGGMIGANAFALPGGTMVVTDELVTLSKSDTEIIAVLAHELGHVKQRHAFRQSLQGVLAGLILAAVTGDVSSVGSGLPAVLMQMRYSREHELEADGFALNALQKACLPPKAFADILQRLQNQAVGAKKPEEAKKETSDKTAKTTLPRQDKDFVSEMLATHPDTQARIKPFLVAKQNCN